MIEKQVYRSLNRSLNSIINDPINVSIKEYFRVFVYDKKKPTATFDENKTLVTYREVSRRLYSKERKTLEEAGIGIYRYINELRFKIIVTIDIKGNLAEDIIKKIYSILANNETNFYENDLAFISFSDITNLTFLENGAYKERYAMDIVFDYTDRDVSEEGDLIKDIEFNLIEEK